MTASLAASTGVDEARDVAAYLLAEPAARDGVRGPGPEHDRTGYLTALHKATGKYVLGEGD